MSSWRLQNDSLLNLLTAVQLSFFLTCCWHGKQFFQTLNTLSIHFISFIECFSFMVFFSEFDKIYNRLDVTLIERGESFYQDMMPKVVADLEQKGL